MFKTRACRSEVSNGVVLSTVRVNPALKAIAYGRAITDFVEFTGVFVTTATGPEKAAIGRFVAAAERRSARSI